MPRVLSKREKLNLAARKRLDPLPYILGNDHPMYPHCLRHASSEREASVVLPYFESYFPSLPSSQPWCFCILPDPPRKGQGAYARSTNPGQPIQTTTNLQGTIVHLSLTSYIGCPSSGSRCVEISIGRASCPTLFSLQYVTLLYAVFK